MTLTPDDYQRGYNDAMAERAIPLPEGEPGGDALVHKVALAAGETCAMTERVIHAYLAAVIPEGEVKELVRRLRIHGGAVWTQDRRSETETEAADIIERQAASLATVERERDDVRADALNDQLKCKAWGTRAEKAEASLASARREALEEAAQIAEGANELPGSPTATRRDLAWLAVPARIRALSSPRQEGSVDPRDPAELPKGTFGERGLS